MENKTIKVIVLERKTKKGPYYLTAFDKLYHLVPNKVIDIEEKVYRSFKQYFKIATEEKKNEVETVVETVVKTSEQTIPKKEKNDDKFRVETIVLDAETDSKKKNGLAEFLEMKKKVADMGINTQGMKKAELKKILENN